MRSRLPIFVCALFAVGTLGAFQNSAAILADEPFTSAAGALNAAGSGSGWAGPWQVQNNSTAVPGYNVTTILPLTYSGLAQSGGYATGGTNWQNSGRTFDTSAEGPFTAYLQNGLIGNAGQTLYFGLLMRQDRSTSDEMSVTLHSGASPAWWVGTPGVAVGYFGGAKNWALKLNGTVYATNIPLVTGQAAFLVVRIDFAATNVVSLYVNPSLKAMPSAPDAAAKTTSSVAFRSLAFYGGPDSGESSIDEIRLATDWSAWGGATNPLPAALKNLSAVPGDGQISLAWSAVSGASAYKIYRSVPAPAQLQATVAGTAYTQTGLSNGTAYTFYAVASNAAGDGPASASVTATPRGAAPLPHPSLGTNLSELKDYSRSWPFVDTFKMARPWISQTEGASWGTGPALQLDANGWITSLQTGQYAETIIFDNALDDAANFPRGDYTLLYDGEGTLAFDLQSAQITSQTPGRMVVNVPSGGNGVFLMVKATNPANPIRNIRFIMPGFESTWQTQPFHPLFLQRLKSYGVLRFMDWMLTNGSTVQNWTDRAAPGDYTYVLRGVPLEVLIQLANATGANPWFNIPAAASDDYVLQFAKLVSAQLGAGLKFYVEYSNETWNGSFSQNNYFKTQGQKLGLSSDPTLAAAFYTAYRSVQIFGIFQSAAPGSPLVRVIASQAANSWLSDQTLGFQNAFSHADALAIAPYFNCSDTGSGGFGMLGDPASASAVDAMSVDGVIDIEQAHISGCALQAMKSNAAVAQKYGIKLVAYEGGQSLTGFNGAENDSMMTSLFKAANRSPRMTFLYADYLKNWVSVGGDVLVHYNEVGPFTKYGSWGALEYQGQDPNTAPKYQSLMDFAAQHP